MKKNILIASFLLNFFTVCSQDAINTQIKNQFFPLEIGNKYYYTIYDGYKFKNIARHDTLEIIKKEFFKEFTVYSFNNGLIYYVKNDSVFQANPGHDRIFRTNLLYYKVEKKAEHYLHQGSCGIYGTVYATYLGSFKIENNVYKDCYRFQFHNGNDSERILVHGIGLFQTIQNGKKTVLTAVELK